MMNYTELIRSSYGSEEQMWDAVARVDGFLEQARKAHPGMVRDFMEQQYEAMNGKHINEWLAKKLVSEMWHTGPSGEKVMGEAVTPDEAMQLVSAYVTPEQYKWDAYVAANAFAHDLGTTGIPKPEIMTAAKMFWFHDEDMPGGNKVYWYFKDRIFG